MAALILWIIAVILMDLYRSGLNIAYVYYTLARVLGNAGLILDTRPKNKPTLTSTGNTVGANCLR